MDITDLIMNDHERQRNLFVLLDQADRHDRRTLGRIWRHLEALLEVHAQIEEELFYPRLLQELAGAEEDTKDAIGDHNGIREGIARAREAEVGSPRWWEGVSAAREENDEHMGEEEGGPLRMFRLHIPAEERERLAVQFAALEADLMRRELSRAGTVDLSDKDPDDYVDENS